MGKKFFTICLCSLAFASCSKFDLDYNQTVVNKDKEAINENAASILGTIDPNQTWNSINSGFVTITADADLDNIAKVQILTESPFLNPDAKVLNEVSATNGQTVTLVFDAPNVYTRLIAACVSEDGVYYTKGFDVGTTEVSFQNTSAASRASRRASAESFSLPSASNFYLPVNDAFFSYGAMRTIRSGQGDTTKVINIWENSGWNRDISWSVVNDKTISGSDWYTTANTIRRDATDELSADDKTQLYDIFNTWLFWSKANYDSLFKNNLEAIRNSEMVKLYSNQLEATGEPVIISPIQATSTDFLKSHIYYYYYNPADTTGMTQDEVVQFLKKLPKFKAISGYHSVTKELCGTNQFFKLHEYLLPYYGDAPLLNTTTLSDYTSDGHIYRIRNGVKVQDVDYYMSYNPKNNSFMTEKLEGADQLVLFQLWQIFKDSEGKCYLYNIGAQSFFYYTGQYNTAFTALDYVNSDCPPYLMTQNGEAYRFARSNSTSNYLGTDFTTESATNKGIWSNKTEANGSTINWYLEEYTEDSWHITPLTTISMISEKNITAQNVAIPEGYKIGFMLRKLNSKTEDHYLKAGYTEKRSGEVYADGRLNKEINNFTGHFGSAKTMYGMLDNDPRAAIFNANGKTFMVFEDGSDCNYADVIFYLSNGIKRVDETPDPNTEAYTMCFEDRPLTADYDMNDVVLSCTRKNATTLTLSLIACGAKDSIFVHDALGLWEYNGKEVHQIFGLENNGFVNTVVGGTTMEPVSADITVPESMTIPAYLKNIFIENKSTGKTIKIADQGQAPCAIIIPGAFNYPRERVSIITAYPKFKNWVQDATADTDWYLYEDEEQVYPNPVSAE